MLFPGGGRCDAAQETVIVSKAIRVVGETGQARRRRVFWLSLRNFLGVA